MVERVCVMCYMFVCGRVEPMSSQVEERDIDPVHGSDLENVQSMDGVLSKPDIALPHTVTSDYYSDSAREEMTKPGLDNPQIGQAHIPMVQPTLPAQEPSVAPTDQTTIAHIKDGQEVIVQF